MLLWTKVSRQSFQTKSTKQFFTSASRSNGGCIWPQNESIQAGLCSSWWVSMEQGQQILWLGWRSSKFQWPPREQATKAIQKENLTFDTIYTSILKRANDTTDIIIDALDPKPKSVIRHWRLNERHYGALTGLNKAEMAQIHGKNQVQIWRRSFDIPPPPMTKDHSCHNEIGKFMIWSA